MQQVRSDQDINHIVARMMRERAAESQEKFWSSVGVSQPTGSQYEKGSRPIPDPVRALLFIKYEAGLKQDTSTVEGAQELREFAGKAIN